LTFDSAAPASARRSRGGESKIENSYIVKLKKSANATNHINSLPFPFSIEDESSPITYWWPNFFKGYSGIFVGADLDAIMASPDVEYVEKNAIVRHMPLSFTSHILNPAHRSAKLIQKPTHRGTSKPSAPESLTAARM
jgi:Peptidase inhibitor I9